MNEPDIAPAYEHWQAQVPEASKFGPVAAVYFGPTPETCYSTPEKGVLGVTANDIIFIGAREWTFQVRIPLADLRWISDPSTTLYAEHDDYWRVHGVWVDGWGRFTEVVQDISDAVVTPFADFEPVSAQRLRQDMLGRWSPDRSVTLFLAPDRLLADWRTEVVFAQIRGIRLINEIEEFRGASLLRLEIQEPDQPRHVIGFALPEEVAQGWAQKVGMLTGLEVTGQSVRKEKNADVLVSED